jgi:predicted TIM-barrel fold metal-dependent hydrolase
MAPDVALALETMDHCNIGSIVNLDGRWGDELEENLDRYDRAHPGRFATFCHVNWRETNSPGFGSRLAHSLETSVAAGACGLKIWKDLGLDVRDDRRQLLLPDDARLDPLWETASRLRVPVLIHTGDPIAFFHPVDERNERLEQLRRSPRAARADLGPFWLQRLHDALEALVARHPGVNWIAAHVACQGEHLARVSRLLATYPNLHVDTGACMNELGRQPRAARHFFERHADRILFGSDMFAARAAEYQLWARFLETEDEYFSYAVADPLHGRWQIYGLGLSDDVLAQVYADNARRLIPGVKA